MGSYGPFGHRAAEVLYVSEALGLTPGDREAIAVAPRSAGIRPQLAEEYGVSIRTIDLLRSKDGWARIQGFLADDYDQEQEWSA